MTWWDRRAESVRKPKILKDSAQYSSSSAAARTTPVLFIAGTSLFFLIYIDSILWLLLYFSLCGCVLEAFFFTLIYKYHTPYDPVSINFGFRIHRNVAHWHIGRQIENIHPKLAAHNSLKETTKTDREAKKARNKILAYTSLSTKCVTDVTCTYKSLAPPTDLGRERYSIKTTSGWNNRLMQWYIVVVDGWGKK
jgi:hypothetical protein